MPIKTNAWCQQQQQQQQRDLSLLAPARFDAWKEDGQEDGHGQAVGRRCGGGWRKWKRGKGSGSRYYFLSRWQRHPDAQQVCRPGQQGQAPDEKGFASYQRPCLSHANTAIRQ